jgi:hypothetical protein
MLHFKGDFEQYQVAKACKKYIPLFLKKKGDQLCYVPYWDDNQAKKRYIKFALLAGEWIYVDNSQES